MRILLVEDGEAQALQLTSLLAQHGYAVDVAASGEAALAQIDRAIPDAIVSDVLMAGMDGFDLCARVKASAKTAAVPVMLLTGRGDIRHVLHALVAGADNFITRPHDDALLLARLARMLAARGARADAPLHAVIDGEQFVLPPGPPAWIEVLVSSLEDGARAEVTLHEREAMVEIERRRAEEANHAKDGFLAVVSHELRTPLTAVLGWVHLLREGNVPADELPAALSRLERSALAQAHLVEDLLDASRIVQGGFRILHAPVDLREVASNVVASSGPVAAARSIALTFTHEPGSFLMRGDAARLEQVLGNLIQNGLKFTPVGGAVQVMLRAIDDTLEIRVQDNGRGIAPSFLPHAFGRFRQESSAGDRLRTGLGLGLSIVQALVEAHGGSVTAASEGVGLGATFTVTLPRSAPTVTDAMRVTPVPEEVSPSVMSDGLLGINVLLYEPEAAVRTALVHRLEAEGATVIAVEDLESAIRAARARPVDVVLSGVTDEDPFGATFLKEVRTAGCRVPAVALTSNVRPLARARAFAAGFADHLSRPVDPHALVLTLARLAHEPDAAAHQHV